MTQTGKGTPACMDMSEKKRPSMMHGEARLHYLDSDFETVIPGRFVRCAVSGDKIPLAELRYWSVSRQEAYRDAGTAFQRYMQSRQIA